MKRYKGAMILSIIYCGLGQIYKGQKLKGVCYIIGYTLLIGSLILRESLSYSIYFPVLSLIILMWLMGIIDAYIDDDDPVGVEQNPVWARLASILEIAVICGTLGTIVLISYPDSGSSHVIQNPMARIFNSGVNRFEKKPQVPETGNIFSIQVAAFKNYEGAVEVHNAILAKGFPARIDYQTTSSDGLYHVLVGNFKTEKEARTFADRLNRLIGLNYIIVSRPATP